MKSIRELYRIGTGPSSSHTMGPRRASAMFAERTGGASKYIVTLYGALAATGKGHLTDVAITDTLSPLAPVEIEWQPNVFLPYHPNGMKFTALDAEGNKTDEWTVFSIGGGELAEEGNRGALSPDVYTMKDRKSTRLNSSHNRESRMPSSA